MTLNKKKRTNNEELKKIRRGKRKDIKHFFGGLRENFDFH